MSFKDWIQHSFRPGFSVFALMLWVVIGCTEAQQAASESSGDDPARVLAVVNGVELTEGRVINQAKEDFKVMQRQRLEFESKQKETRYDILRRNLDKLIAEELIKAEAEAQGVSQEELLEAEVDGKLDEPAPEEISRIYEINKGRLGGKPLEEVRGQIVDFLRGRAKGGRRDAFIKSLKAKYTVDDRMEPMRYEIAIVDRPVKGAPEASVTLVEFSDFQCPYCTRLTDSMVEVMDQYGDRIRRVFLQFPLNSIHPQAQKAAEASLCAHDQDKFWDMHASLFEAPMSLKPEDLTSKASAIGLDMEQFEQCLNSNTQAEKVSEDLQQGLEVGVSGTPALFINGRPLRGAATTAQISAMIEEELKAKERE